MTKKENSAGAVIYYVDKEKIYFLLLQNTLKKTYFGFPKGHIEENEKIEECVKREIEEEVNLKDIKFIPGFKYEMNWFFKFENEIIRKNAVFLLVKVSKQEAGKVKINHENEAFFWLEYGDAVEKMKIKDNKELLVKAYNFVKNYEKQKKLF